MHNKRANFEANAQTGGNLAEMLGLFRKSHSLVVEKACGPKV